MIAKVLVEISNINVDKTFDYIVPTIYENKIKVGIRVRVPFANRVLEGFVLEIADSTNFDNLKEIIDIIDDNPILNDELLKLGKYMSEKYYSTLISCYQTMLPKALKAKNGVSINKKIEKYIKLNDKDLSNYKFNDKQKIIIDILINKKEVIKNELELISKSSVKTLLKNDIIFEMPKEKYRLNFNDSKKEDNKVPTVEQKQVIDKILNNNTLPKTYLLHGVTGSGKTIIYMEIVEYMLKLGKDSIFLVPEISLTPQMVQQFRRRFGNLIAILHSRLNDGEKYDEYRKIVNNEVHVVIGARSAIFAPFKNIGVIIIDEEHTNTYKQENNPKYNTIDIAIERSKYHKCMVVLGSATPSLETYAKSLKNIYELLELKKRVNNQCLPNISIVDLNKEYKSNKIFSTKLIDSINDRLNKKEQVILLLNRRGYSSFITCSNCGYVEKCPNCDITLTYHKSSNVLRCHYCGYATNRKIKCPNCNEDSMKNLGLGTEKIEEELNKLFNARVVRMDLDTTVKKGSHEKIINDFRNHKYDILLGTQMIAKGLDFSNVTLVGIINADTSLIIPNYKSSEYTFQLLCQTSGRSGRGEKLGEVIIQTFNPEHYAIEYAKRHDYIGFFKYEMNMRKKLEYPPYFNLLYIRIIGNNYDYTYSESLKISRYLKNELSDLKMLGPTSCNVFKLNNKYRFGIIIKYKRCEKLDNVLKTLIEHYRNNNKIKIDIDINPNTL